MNHSEDTILIGQRHGWGAMVPFGIAIPDERHHVYLVGKTGTGKTTLLRNMIVQHVNRGDGVALIDPHGDLAEELLSLIDRKRSDHVVYFNPGDIEYPIGLNLLYKVERDDRHLVASGIVSAFKSLWRDSWGPRLEYILYNGVAALLDSETESLLGLGRLLQDNRYRARILRHIKDPFIKSFWEFEYESYDQRFRAEAIAPIQNKVGQFLLNPVIRNILGQVRSRVRLPFVMDRQRILICNLSKGRLGHEKANLLGSLLVSQFQLSAMERAREPESKRKDFFLFIDEFQNFSTDSFASILAEARKYRLSLILSHQYIDQLSIPVRQAVFGNVGTIMSFRVGHSDAAILEKEFGGGVSAATLSDLDRFECVVRLLQGGTNPEPFRATTFPPAESSLRGRKQIIENSRMRFAVPRAVVEAKLKRWVNN